MSLAHLIEFAQKTGDRLIIHDSVNGRDLAVLPFAEYEKLRLGETGETPELESDPEPEPPFLPSIDDEDAEMLPTDEDISSHRAAEPPSLYPVLSWESTASILAARQAIPYEKTPPAVVKDEPLDEEPIFLEEPV